MLSNALVTPRSSLFDITLIEKIVMADKRTFKDSSVSYDNLHVSVVTTFLILFSIPCTLFTFSTLISVFLFVHYILVFLVE
jgi:hypothetical protein